MSDSIGHAGDCSVTIMDAFECNSRQKRPMQTGIREGCSPIARVLTKESHRYGQAGEATADVAMASRCRDVRPPAPGL